MIRDKSGAVPRIFTALFIAASAAIFVSCVVDSRSPPPYVLGKPACVIGGREGYYLVAGIEFDFYNVANRDVSGLTVSAIVYDRETGANPFIGSNQIKATLEGGIEANSKASLAIPLDPYLYAAPSAPYIVDFFRVSRIDYADGSSWVDSDGTYYTGSE